MNITLLEVGACCDVTMFISGFEELKVTSNGINSLSLSVNKDSKEPLLLFVSRVLLHLATAELHTVYFTCFVYVT